MKNLLLLAIVLLLSSCLKNEAFKLENPGYKPVSIENDWDISTPEAEQMNTNLLNKAYELIYKDDRFRMARSLLVFRNGKLVAEAYPHNIEDINHLNNIQSCTKSVTSLLTGIAIQQNLISSLDEKLFDIFPEAFDEEPNKRDITLHDALTMQTGLEFNNSVHTLNLYNTKENSAKYVLSLDKSYPPGLVMNYNDGAPQLISKAIEIKSGQKLHEFADDYLFSKLNIKNWKWEVAEDGTTFGAFSLFLRARDLGKIGHLLLQNGNWNNEQLADTSFLAEATSAQVSAHYNNEPYGYYFWILPAWNAYNMDGHGGQFLLVVPEKELVVVYTAWPYTSNTQWDRGNEIMSLIINSCE